MEDRGNWRGSNGSSLDGVVLHYRKDIGWVWSRTAVQVLHNPSDGTLLIQVAEEFEQI